MPLALKVLVVDPDYPRDSNLYGDVFVHTRVKSYPSSWDLNVIGFNPMLKEPDKYVWENIKVYLSPELGEIKKQIKNYNPDIILIHFIQHELMNTLLEQKKPLVIFFHGFESTSWRRRLFNFNSPGDFPYLLSYIRNTRNQLAALKKFIIESNVRDDVHFVFVSDWLRKATEADLGIPIFNKHVIANPIDTSLFHFNKKDPELRKKILVIRSFRRRNYANDILVNAILELSKIPYFKELSFSIYGEGYLFGRLTKKISHFKNISLHNHFVPNGLIPEIHRQHGIFFCFSRIDTQGVTMCEAMSSGLVTFSSNVAAIPEFVENGKSGFVCSNISEIVKSMNSIFQSPDFFLKISGQGSNTIEQKCGIPVIIPKEVGLILQLTNQ